MRLVFCIYLTSLIFNSLVVVVIVAQQNLTESLDFLPESETFGQCSRQLDVEIHKRNCRYGKCENVKNGTDYVCHCDLVSDLFK